MNVMPVNRSPKKHLVNEAQLSLFDALLQPIILPPIVGSAPSPTAVGLTSLTAAIVALFSPEVAPLPSGEMTLAKHNVSIIELLQRIQSQDRTATTEERQQLSQYAGWGGCPALWDQTKFAQWQTCREIGLPLDTPLFSWVNRFGPLRQSLQEWLSPEAIATAQASILSAYFTPVQVVNVIWQALQRLGFRGGRILEPGAGVGTFIGHMPTDIRQQSTVTAIEKDVVSAQILSLCYPEITVEAAGYETVALADSFDLVVGNVPFGDVTVYDPQHRDICTEKIHNYFIAKSVRLLRPGGLLALITTSGTLDSERTTFRCWLADEQMGLVGAIRLPGNVFGGTQVTTDVLFMQKGEGVTRLFADHTFERLTTIRQERDPSQPPNTPDDEVITRLLRVNEYFDTHPTQIIGEVRFADEVGQGGLYRADRATCYLAVSDELTDWLAAALDHLPRSIYEAVEPTLITAQTQPDSLTVALADTVRIQKKDIPKRRIYDAFITLKTAFQQLWRVERDEQQADSQVDELRHQLRTNYLTFVSRYGRLNRNRAVAWLETVDPQFAIVQALETVSREATQQGGTSVVIGEATILHQRVYPRSSVPTKAENLTDAIAICRAYYGLIIPRRIAALLDVLEAEATSLLLHEEALFIDPVSTQPIDARNYLSGHVREKLAYAEQCARTNPQFEANVKALQAVQPHRVPAHLIEFGLGANWLPPHIISQWMRQQFGLHTIEVVYNTRSHLFECLQGDFNEPSPKNRAEGTAHRLGSQLVEAALNHKTLLITKKVIDKDGDERTVRDIEATSAAVQAQERLQDLFLDFARSNAEYAASIEETYNHRFCSYVPRRYGAPPFRHYPGASTHLTPRRHQYEAVSRALDQDCLFAQSVGTGKAQPLTAKILTPDGWAVMGSICVGDQVISQDGQPTVVTGVFPQGEKEIFRVTFSDGATTECCAEHLWLTYTYAERNAAYHAQRKGKQWTCAQPKVRSLTQIQETLVAPHLGAKNHSIPLVKAVEFPPQCLRIPPYLLGVLLGDGGMTQDSVIVSTADEELLQQVQSYLPSTLHLTKKGKYDYVIAKRTGTGKFNSLINALRQYDLMGRHSATKFIPADYLRTSISDRTALLQGLLDTDGTIDKRTGSISFTTISLQLANGVTELVNSLGGTVRRAVSHKSYTYHWERRQGQPAYLLTLCLPNTVKPFRLTRKTECWKPKTSYQPVRYIVGVEPIGTKQAQCIAVAHPSHLYVTDHYIVTHNTAAMQMTGMELRRLGIARKVLYTVQNSTVADFSQKFRELYPAALLCVPTAADMEAKNRAAFLRRIATNAYDAIIIPQSFLKQIPDDAATVEAFIGEEISRLTAVLAQKNESGRSAKKTAKAIENLKARILARRYRQQDRTVDRVPTFGELGIDALFLDEAHRYKRLGFFTNRRNVKGIDTQGSEDALSALMKCRSIQARRGRVVLATGTPISNTMAEAWTLLRFVAPQRLEAMHMTTFDEFAGAFGQVISSFELTAGGNFKAVDRFAKFVNIKALSDLYRSHVDVVLTDDVAEFKHDKTIPQLKNGEFTRIILPQTPGVAAEMSRIRQELIAFEKMTGQEKRDYSHLPLVLFGQARKATLDLRLIDPQADDESGSKTNRAVSEIGQRYQSSAAYNGVQLVFADLYQSPAYEDVFSLEEDGPTGRGPAFTRQKVTNRFNLFTDITRKLIALGVAPDEIGVVPDEMEKREAVFAKVRTGQIRVLMGSSERMGVGVNVQDRLCALHHLDAPMRPTDFEQRNGRLLRQGNLHASWGIPVEVLTYGVDKTMDATAYGRLAIKQKFINQVLKGEVSDGSIPDISADDDFASLSFDQMMATLSGSTKALLLSTTQLEADRLRRQQKTFNEGVIRAGQIVTRSRLRWEQQQALLPGLETDIARVKNAWLDAEQTVTLRTLSSMFQGQCTSEFSQFIAQFLTFLAKKARTDYQKRSTQTLLINDIPVAVTAYYYVAGQDMYFRYQVDNLFGGEFSKSGGFMTSLRVRMEKIDQLAEDVQKEIVSCQQEEAAFLDKAQQVFPKIDQLTKLDRRVAELKRELEREAQEAEV